MVLPPPIRAKASDGKGKGKKEERDREGKDGLKCYVQQKKPIIGIAQHPARTRSCAEAAWLYTHTREPYQPCLYLINHVVTNHSQ